MIWIAATLAYLFLGFATALFNVWFLAEEWDGEEVTWLILGWPVAWIIYPIARTVDLAETFLKAVHTAKHEKKNRP